MMTCDLEYRHRGICPAHWWQEDTLNSLLLPRNFKKNQPENARKITSCLTRITQTARNGARKERSTETRNGMNFRIMSSCSTIGGKFWYSCIIESLQPRVWSFFSHHTWLILHRKTKPLAQTFKVLEWRRLLDQNNIAAPCRCEFQMLGNAKTRGLGGFANNIPTKERVTFPATSILGTQWIEVKRFAYSMIYIVSIALIKQTLNGSAVENLESSHSWERPPRNSLSERYHDPLDVSVPRQW